MDLKGAFQLVRRGTVLLLLVVGVSVQAMHLGFESGSHLVRAYPPAISAFIQLVNTSLEYGTQGAVPRIPLVSGGPGIRAAASLGFPMALAVGFSVFGSGTGTVGEFHSARISVKLELSYADLHGALLISPWPGLLWLGMFAGIGNAAVHYSVEFPTTPAFPFVPAVGEWAFRGRAFVAGMWVRAAFSLLPVLTVGVETGYRWALFPGLWAHDLPMDLDGSGGPDVLDLSGFWLGLSLRVEFSL